MAGLLDRWTKKKQKKQLEAVEKKAEDVKVEKKVVGEEAEIKKAEDSKSAEEKKVKSKTVKKAKSKLAGEAYKILVKPVVSEKAAMAESRGEYTFIVDTKANKIEIKKAIKQVYGVMPEKVRVINMEGKRVRFGRRFGRRSDWKKAVIFLPKGKTINIHEGV